MKAARNQAMKEYVRDHPDVDEKQIKVSLSMPKAGLKKH
jgi:hypothetical protein